MKSLIHQLEQEAYSSVLRAFKAQADAITWDKESLITELRKELRLSNEEHRELLGRVNSDDVIRRIRTFSQSSIKKFHREAPHMEAARRRFQEWRQSGGNQQGILSTGPQPGIHDLVPSPVSASRKKQNVVSSLPSQSFGGPSPGFYPAAVTTFNQPSSTVAKRGPMGPKGKKQKPGLVMPGATKTQYPPSGPSGRGQFVNRISKPTEGASFDPLIGRKVRTRWPDDNNFYEAVITDYNPVQGLHALVYDIGTANETWEWVNLSEISPQDIQWDNDAGDQGVNRAIGRVSAPTGVGRGRGLTKAQPAKDFPPPQNGVAKKVSDYIQLLHTDTLIKEVERIFGAYHPDPVEIEKVKKVLKEHEQSLIDAISRLGDISDVESDECSHFMHGHPMEA
ncbi:unnamed protein product [Cuscuta epithymum]|uniref:ENT domain-containing protein n=1 Tax=Cuscuta epithymum TaxID=186058 RepID=A0AAV0EXP6_9ASTE|nr:unnamed protein product [Cuscuta epithymum]